MLHAVVHDLFNATCTIKAVVSDVVLTDLLGVSKYNTQYYITLRGYVVVVVVSSLSREPVKGKVQACMPHVPCV